MRVLDYLNDRDAGFMSQEILPTSESVTHQHLLCVINTILSRGSIDDDEAVRILDAGCGNGKLLLFLARALPILHPNKRFEFYGFDVLDHGVQEGGFFEETSLRLADGVPGVDWGGRLRGFRIGQDWDFSGVGFRFIVSNQVLEHVQDKTHFFKNVRNNLQEGGVSIHLAPLSHIIHEGHIYLPWAHRIRSHGALLAYIRVMSQLGVGKYRVHRRYTGCSIDQFAQRHADYMFFWTSYSSEAATIASARSSGLRASFRYSHELFATRARRALGLRSPHIYRYRDASFADAIAVKFFRYLSSVTLVCEKRNVY